MILFVDPISVRPYSNASLRQGALGGTEATIIRVAEALDGFVAQKGRKAAEGRYLPYTLRENIDQLIVLRDPEALLEWHEKIPSAKPYLWLHDLLAIGTFNQRQLTALARSLVKIGTTVICVSEFHSRQAEIAVAVAGVSLQELPIKVIYNPIDDELLGNDVSVDPYKLVFFSSPHKGLSVAIDAFRYIHKRNRFFKFYIANPGYQKNNKTNDSGIYWLGELSHGDIIKHVRTALCVFYPNFVYPETFGLVFAESNAVGTPVLTHPIGAAPEVLNGDQRQLRAVNSALVSAERLSHVLPKGPWRDWVTRLGGIRGGYQEYLRVLSDWSKQRPSVTANEALRMRNVKAQWENLLYKTR